MAYFIELLAQLKVFSCQPGNDRDRRSLLGMLAKNFRVVKDVSLPHLRPVFLPRDVTSCCIFPSTLPRPCLTMLPTSWMGLKMMG